MHRIELHRTLVSSFSSMKVIIEISPERKVVWAKMQNFKPDADVRAELHVYF